MKGQSRERSVVIATVLLDVLPQQQKSKPEYPPRLRKAMAFVTRESAPFVTRESALPGAAVKVFLYPVNEEREARENYAQK